MKIIEPSGMILKPTNGKLEIWMSLEEIPVGSPQMVAKETLICLKFQMISGKFLTKVNGKMLVLVMLLLNAKVSVPD